VVSRNDVKITQSRKGIILIAPLRNLCVFA
jgi:hypothetical protein